MERIENIIKQPNISNEDRAVVEKVRNKLNKQERLINNEMRIKKTTPINGAINYIFTRANNN